MQTPRKRVQFLTMGVVLLVVVLGALVFTGWFAYHSSQLADSTLKSANKVSSDVPKMAAVTDFATCKKAPGSKMLETSPEQCVITTGKKFTDPGQSVKYLVIKEWGVKVDVSNAALTDAEYVKAGPLSDGVERALLATKNTVSMDYTCGGQVGDGGEPVTHIQSSDQDYLLRSKTTNNLVTDSNHRASDFVKIGSYYYIYAHNTGHGDCSVTNSSLAKEAAAAGSAYAKSAILAE